MNEEYDFMSFVNIITRNDSLINVDMDDISRLINGCDTLTYCVGFADGNYKGAKAGQIAARLLGKENKYTGVLLHVTGGPNLSLYEAKEATSQIMDICVPDADLIIGIRIDKNYNEKIRLDVIGVN